MMFFCKGPAKAHPTYCWSVKNITAARTKAKEMKAMFADPSHLLWAVMDEEGLWQESSHNDWPSFIQYGNVTYQGHFNG